VVALVDVASGATRRLTSHDLDETQPVFSPDGTRVAYWHPQSGVRENQNAIWVAPATGGDGKEGTASLGCGFGAVDHDQTAGNDLGATVTVTAAVGTTQSGLTNVNVNGSAAGYSGALDALKLAAGTAPNWVISGGTTTDSATLTGALAFNSLGIASSGTMTVTDSADQGSVTFTATSTGDTGAITDTATGKTVATFTVDQSGNGTVTFSNGTTAQISAWQLLG